MALEDLPIIREEDINEQTAVVDRAEIRYNTFPGNPSTADLFTTELYFVLGRTESGNIFVTNRLFTDERLNGNMISSNDPDRPYKIISAINNYNPLISATGKTE